MEAHPKTRLGLPIKARANASFRLSPPESLLAFVLRKGLIERGLQCHPWETDENNVLG